ncbi:hypothetical protein [Streptacidiphilus cavernicola]|uniref:Uncharacterized protein n=1 Tax=Streptacidiphilus cavernicola TaxID=3342716 RepID=A0ABV6VQT9_9ACTN
MKKILLCISTVIGTAALLFALAPQALTAPQAGVPVPRSTGTMHTNATEGGCC